MMKNKKIIILALVLLIIAGIVVVGLKGFNVDFMLKGHDSIEYKISDDFKISDVEDIAKSVFGEKKFKVRIIELFNDAVSINAENITTEEADNLVKKLDNKYKKVENPTDVEGENAESTETPESAETSDENTITETTSYEIISNPKIKIFSLLKPFIIPSIIAGIIIIIYVGFRYKKLKSINVILNLIGLIAISVLAILSVIAITRFPITIYVLPTIMLVVLSELILFCANQEKKLKNINED